MQGPSQPELSAANAFAGARLVRAAELRGPESLKEALADPLRRFVLLREDRALLRVNGAPDFLFDAHDTERLGAIGETVVLLGHEDRAPRLAAQITVEGDLPDGVKAVDLRSLAVQGLLPGSHLGLLALARSLLHWHGAHGFCARCGGASRMSMGGFRRDCPGCGAQHFPRTDPVSIMLVTRGESCLLGRQPRFPPGVYSCLAGFIEPGETIEEAVRREVLEEAGIAVGAVRYVSSQPWPFPSSLMIGCEGEAVSETITRDENELEDCRWFAREEVRAMLAGSHPEGLSAPPPVAIANRLMTGWAERS